MPELTRRLGRGAVPTSRSRLAAATPFHLAPGAPIGAPPNFIVKPQQISFWGNYDHGDCVTAEEAFAKACNGPEIFIPEQDVINWATAHGVLEGAQLPQVLQFMQSDGFREGAVTYDDGPYYSVDWTNPNTLQTAIVTGPVKIGVAADQLESVWWAAGSSAAGGKTWFGTGFSNDANEDHCVTLCGYGTIAWLAQQLNVQVPAGVNGNSEAYALFTWDSIGIIDQSSMLAITHEAWLRRPTTVIKTQVLFDKTIITNNTSPLTPSIAALNGCLYLAWKGDGNDNLNVMYSADGGATFGHKYTSPETSPQAPCLCAHHGSLYIGWKGDGNDNLNVARVAISGANITGFTNKKTLDDTSPKSPSLASFGGRLYLSWKGDGNDNLNVMYSADDGNTFGHKYTSGETSPQAPGLCASGNSLYITWKGDGNDNLNVAQVVVAGANITGFANKVTLSDTSPVSPCLASNGNTLYLSWKGDGNDFLNVIYSYDGGRTFGNKAVSSETSPQPPSLCSMNGVVYIAWKGDGNDDLNVARVEAGAGAPALAMPARA
jgi:hypothetical protein